MIAGFKTRTPIAIAFAPEMAAECVPLYPPRNIDKLRRRGVSPVAQQLDDWRLAPIVFKTIGFRGLN